ncbi:MAG: acyltransferase [Eubacteriales bacterium]|nr:acyltransferase [Eubacteriales bacterium]
MAKQKRQANFELLRICAMFMVVVLHWISASRALPEDSGALDGTGAAAVVLESFCIVAVNVYVLIGGYFLSEAGFSLRRVLRLIGQTLFYTLLIPPVLTLLGVLPAAALTDVYRLWSSLFPVQSGQYWFVSAYVILCLFSPFLNEGLRRLDKRRLQQLLAAFLFFFCIGKSLSPLQFATDRYGYDFGWFCVVYLTGGYLRRYGLPFFQNARRGFLVYAASALLTAGAELLLTVLAARFPGLAYYASVPFHYNYLLCLTGAVGLFYGFSGLSVGEGMAERLILGASPAVLGVYLIHQQADVAGRWFGWINGLTGRLGAGWSWEPERETALLAGPFGGLLEIGRFTGLLLLQALLVFLFCLSIDWLRGRLFLAARRKEKG